MLNYSIVLLILSLIDIFLINLIFLIIVRSIHHHLDEIKDGLITEDKRITLSIKQDGD